MVEIYAGAQDQEKGNWLFSLDDSPKGRTCLYNPLS